MSRLLIVVQGLPEFSRYSRLDCPDYLLDALNRTWEWLSRNIRNFKPRKSSMREDLVKWINGYLYWRIKDLTSPGSPTKATFHYSLDAPIEFGDSQEKITHIEQVAEQGQLLGTSSNPSVLSGLEIYIDRFRLRVLRGYENNHLHLFPLVQLANQKKTQLQMLH